MTKTKLCMLFSCSLLFLASADGALITTTLLIGDDDAFGGMQVASCGVVCGPGAFFDASALGTLEGGGSGLSTPTLVNEAGMDQLTDEDQFIFRFVFNYNFSGLPVSAAIVTLQTGGLGTSGPSNDLNSGTGFGAVPLVIGNGVSSVAYGPFFPDFAGFNAAQENTVRRLTFDVTALLVAAPSGVLTLTLNGDGRNTNDRLAFDFARLDVTHEAPVPEPATLGVCALGLLTVLALRSTKSRGGSAEGLGSGIRVKRAPTREPS